MATSIINEYSQLEPGQPVLVGHIIFKMNERSLGRKKVVEWATQENLKNGLPPISDSNVLSLYRKYKKCQRSFINHQKENFIKFCHEPAHLKQKNPIIEKNSASTSTNPIYVDAATNTDMNEDVYGQNKKLLRTINQLKSVVRQLKLKLSKRSKPISNKKKIK